MEVTERWEKLSKEEIYPTSVEISDHVGSLGRDRKPRRSERGYSKSRHEFSCPVGEQPMDGNHLFTSSAAESFRCESILLCSEAQAINVELGKIQFISECK